MISFSALLLVPLAAIVSCQNQNFPPVDPNTIGAQTPPNDPRKELSFPGNTIPQTRDKDTCPTCAKVRPGNLTCYSCKLDFRPRDYKWDHPCLGRHEGHTVDSGYLVRCGPNDIYCRAERTEVNGVLILLSRECTDQCYYGCRPKGFGINFESCAQCCNSHACNDMYPQSVASDLHVSHMTFALTFSLSLLHYLGITSL